MLGGFGSIAGMIKSLKDNKALTGNRARFDDKRKLYQERSKAKVKKREMTEAERKEFSKYIEKRNNRALVIEIVSVLLSILIFGAIIYVLSTVMD